MMNGENPSSTIHDLRFTVRGFHPFTIYHSLFTKLPFTIHQPEVWRICRSRGGAGVVGAPQRARRRRPRVAVGAGCGNVCVAARALPL
jgi:hypothetical protein